MNLAGSFVAYCVSGLSCPTYSAVPTRDLYCWVACSSKPSAPSRKPSPTVFELGATETFHFMCYQPLLVCFSGRASWRNFFSVPCHFPVQELHSCQARANTFTDFHREHFAHQFLKIICSVLQIFPFLRKSFGGTTWITLRTFPRKNATDMSNTTMIIDTFARLGLWLAAQLARIPDEGLPQTSDLGSQPTP